MIENEYNRDENDVEDFSDFEDFYGFSGSEDEDEPSELVFGEPRTIENEDYSLDGIDEKDL